MKRELNRVVPRISVSAGKMLTLKELSRAENAPITRSDYCFRSWIDRGVKMQGVIVHLPHIRIGRTYFSSVPALLAFLDVLQDVSHASTAMLAESIGPPVVALKGDVFEKRGR